MTAANRIEIGEVTVANDLPFTLIAGPAPWKAEATRWKYPPL